jgi:hypothetical protein
LTTAHKTDKMTTIRRVAQAKNGRLSMRDVLASRRKILELLQYGLLSLIWVAGGLLALSFKTGRLLLGLDGEYNLDLAHHQFEWQVPLFLTSMNYLQGMGDIFFGINYRLFPSYSSGSLFQDLSLVKVAIYGVVLCELTVAAILFGLQLGVSRTVAVAAALLTCICLMPFADASLVYGILPLIPQMGSLIAAALIIGAAFLRFGRRSWRADWPYALVFLLVLCWWSFAAITMLLLSGPFFLLCAVSGVVGASSSTERWRKIGLLAGAALLLISPAIYLFATLVDSAAVVFSKELEYPLASWFYTSILFQWDLVGKTGPLLVLFALAGAVLTLFGDAKPTLRVFAFTLLTYFCTRLIFAFLVMTFDFWRGPAPLYLEFFVIPVYSIFAIRFFAWLLGSLWRIRGWFVPSPSKVEAGLVCSATVAVLVLAAWMPDMDAGFHYPPAATEITSRLASEVGLPLGSVFRGRVHNAMWRNLGKNTNWFDVYATDRKLSVAIGNELRLVGLNYFDIPTLFQYTPTITPLFYALTSRTLALPGDRQVRNAMVLRGADQRILAMLGVRFVIADDRQIGVFPIPHPNVGDYSPTIVTEAKTAADVVARLRSPFFDPTQEIIANVPSDWSGLVPARSSRITFLGASLRLEAESDSRSIVLLPLEFSRCLEATTTIGQGPLLFRANLAETGVLFSGQLDTLLSIKTGPFFNPACRLRDFLDARTLKIGEIPPS